MIQPFDPDEENTNDFDPLVPRAIDLPTVLPRGGLIDPSVGDIAKIFAAPGDPADWPAWRSDLASWRAAARARLQPSEAAYERSETRWARTAYSVAQIWIWDERLFDHERQRFTVDAFPGRTFPAAITRVDLGSNQTVTAASASTTTTTIGQVVSYAADLSVANPSGQLRPGMTATADIVTSDKKNVLLVPNAALRFKPAAAGAAQGGGIAGSLTFRPRRDRPER